MFSIKRLAVIFGMISAVALVAFAQQPATAPTQELRRERMERREKHREARGERMKMRGHRERGGAFRELNLSDAQREQIRAITQRRLDATKTQREELARLREKRVDGTFAAADEARARALREEIGATMEGIRLETEGVLTAEQKARLQQLKIERKAKREERQGERKIRREQRLKERQDRLNKTIL